MQLEGLGMLYLLAAASSVSVMSCTSHPKHAAPYVFLLFRNPDFAAASGLNTASAQLQLTDVPLNSAVRQAKAANPVESE